MKIHPIPLNLPWLYPNTFFEDAVSDLQFLIDANRTTQNNSIAYIQIYIICYNIHLEISLIGNEGVPYCSVRLKAAICWISWYT